jgi:hypothetical protein
VSADRRRFVMVVTNNTVCTGDGLQRVLLAHGAADAIHLDGGGSSKMWIRGRGYVNQQPEDRVVPVAIVVRPNGQCPSDCGDAQCVQLLRPFRAQCVGRACRAGLGAIWNCDEPRVRRARCNGGHVVSEYCASGCMPRPVLVDDVCMGGAIPEPVDAGADADAGMDTDGGTDADAGMDTDVDTSPNAALPDVTSMDLETSIRDVATAERKAGTTESPREVGACRCRATRRTKAPHVAKVLALALVLAAARRRRSRGRRNAPMSFREISA